MKYFCLKKDYNNSETRFICSECITEGDHEQHKYAKISEI